MGHRGDHRAGGHSSDPARRVLGADAGHALSRSLRRRCLVSGRRHEGRPAGSHDGQGAAAGRRELVARRSVQHLSRSLQRQAQRLPFPSEPPWRSPRRAVQGCGPSAVAMERHLAGGRDHKATTAGSPRRGSRSRRSRSIPRPTRGASTSTGESRATTRRWAGSRETGRRARRSRASSRGSRT